MSGCMHFRVLSARLVSRLEAWLGCSGHWKCWPDGFQISIFKSFSESVNYFISFFWDKLFKFNSNLNFVHEKLLYLYLGLCFNFPYWVDRTTKITGNTRTIEKLLCPVHMLSVEFERCERNCTSLCLAVSSLAAYKDTRRHCSRIRIFSGPH